MKRSRRGGRRPQNGQSSHGGGMGNGGGGGGYNPNRVYDSNGPEVKIRGTATHVYEKYLQLARDANASGDRVMAENYLQHAEHYFRIIAAGQAQIQAAQAAQAAQSAQQPSYPQAAPGVVAQPRQASGTEEQPFIETAVPQSSAPSFSLSEAAEAEEEPEEAGAE